MTRREPIAFVVGVSASARRNKEKSVALTIGKGGYHQAKKSPERVAQTRSTEVHHTVS